mgnify:CR=1 FL=1
MQIETILAPRRTFCGIEGGSKKRLLETVANHIAADYPNLDADDLFRSLIARERLGSTGFGHGIAIPHCRLENCTGTIGALVKLAEPIDFDAIDGEPVDIIFALLVPLESHDDHLQTLATLAGAFGDADYRQRLRRADSDTDLYTEALSAPIEA